MDCHFPLDLDPFSNRICITSPRHNFLSDANKMMRMMEVNFSLGQFSIGAFS